MKTRTEPHATCDEEEYINFHIYKKMKNNLYDFCCSAKKVLHLVAVLEWCSYQKYSEVSESNRKENYLVKTTVIIITTSNQI